MDDLKFYFSIFLRRLPWFLVVSTIITAVAVTVAITLPPAYVSQSRLVVQSPTIDPELAATTVQTPALEHLQIVEQRLLTRANMLDIARRLSVLENIAEMTPDQIVRAMRSRTTLETISGRGQATMMLVSFEAGSARTAAAVVNEYVTIIQEADAEFRRGISGDTLEFFAQEVAGLNEELSVQSTRIINFKQENQDALPETLEFRLDKRAELRDAIVTTDRDITRLKNQRERLLQIYEATGQVVLEFDDGPLTPDQQELRALQNELEDALLVFSEENPKVKLLRGRIDRLQARITTGNTGTRTSGGPDVDGAVTIEIQIAEIDSEIDILEEQRVRLQGEIDILNETIERTAEVAIALEELERQYELTRQQYAIAEGRMAQAETGDLIEAGARGQRIDVIEQPNVPNEPTKPNRILIAGGGGFLGLLAGIGLIMLMEMMNGAVRRPEDLVARFGISPFTTIPYIRTRRQLFVQRGLKLATIMLILIGIPAAIYAMHVYYLPVDVVADRVMDRLGVRW